MRCSCWADPYLIFSCSLSQVSAGQGWPAASLKGRSSLLARPLESVWKVYCCHLVAISGSACLAPIGACAPLTSMFLLVPSAYSIQPEDATLALLLADHRVLETSNFLPPGPGPGLSNSLALRKHLRCFLWDPSVWGILISSPRV